MRNLLYISIFILSFCLIAFGQNPPCPAVSIISSDKIFRPGEAIIFKAKVSDYEQKNLKYDWAISNGTLIEGQGTETIKVDTTGINDTVIEARVEIKGLPKNCQNAASEQSIVSGGEHPIPADVYEGNLPLRDEKLRLGAIAVELKEKKDQIALFIISFADKANYSAIKSRASRITNYLTKTKGIKNDRFKIVYSKDRNNSTTIYILPPDYIDIFSGLEENPEKLKP